VRKQSTITVSCQRLELEAPERTFYPLTTSSLNMEWHRK